MELYDLLYALQHLIISCVYSRLGLSYMVGIPSREFKSSMCDKKSHWSMRDNFSLPFKCRRPLNISKRGSEVIKWYIDLN